ncbi:hypothetical protein GALMADRAFT_761938 [Galerina marginata CBS 339.88]|uniref:Uncharacterized protein n=1 Tax=Galerina marginata (strain CBS 339.88) TaxID=685588 RepID=A0A067SYD4_GALM3|nr:hypothetical protein GALMADRAFT_761938 [Galerina marginata CBS 339.88]
MFQSFGYCWRLLRRFFQALVRGFRLRIGGVMMLSRCQASGGKSEIPPSEWLSPGSF